MLFRSFLWIARSYFVLFAVLVFKNTCAIIFYFISICKVYWLGVALPNVNNFEITPSIQSEINVSAQDLFKCMKMVSELYGNQIAALQVEFDKLTPK